MGPPLYMRSVVDRNVVTRRVTLCLGQRQHPDIEDSVACWCQHCRCNWSVSETVAHFLYDSPPWSSCNI